MVEPASSHRSDTAEQDEWTSTSTLTPHYSPIHARASNAAGQGRNEVNRLSSTGDDGAAANGRRAKALKALATELQLLRRRQEIDKSKEISVSGLARDLNVSTASMYNYLGGKALPPVGILTQLLKYWNADTEYSDRILSLHFAVDNPPDTEEPNGSGRQTANLSSQGQGPGGEQNGKPYIFAGKIIDGQATLASALRDHWDEGIRIIEGRSSQSPEFLAFQDWADREGLTEVSRILGRTGRPNRDLMAIAVALDPDQVPAFSGVEIRASALIDLAQEASRWPDSSSANLLTLIFDDGILTVCDGLPGIDAAALLDSRWRQQHGAVFQRLDQLGISANKPEKCIAIAITLMILLDRDELTRNALLRNAMEDGGATRQRWFRELIAEETPAEHEPAHAATVIIARNAAKVQPAANDRRILISAVAAAAIGLCLAPIGLVAGPMAIYASFHTRRSNHTSLRVWAALLGALSTAISVWMSISNFLGSS